MLFSRCGFLLDDMRYLIEVLLNLWLELMTQLYKTLIIKPTPSKKTPPLIFRKPQFNPRYRAQSIHLMIIAHIHIQHPCSKISHTLFIATFLNKLITSIRYSLVNRSSDTVELWLSCICDGRELVLVELLALLDLDELLGRVELAVVFGFWGGFLLLLLLCQHLWCLYYSILLLLCWLLWFFRGFAV